MVPTIRVYSYSEPKQLVSKWVLHGVDASKPLQECHREDEDDLVYREKTCRWSHSNTTQPIAEHHWLLALLFLLLISGCYLHYFALLWTNSSGTSWRQVARYLLHFYFLFVKIVLVFLLIYSTGNINYIM